MRKDGKRKDKRKTDQVCMVRLALSRICLGPSQSVAGRFQHSLWLAREAEDQVGGWRPPPTLVHMFLPTSFPSLSLVGGMRQRKDAPAYSWPEDSPVSGKIGVAAR